jgi:hypothetical protein
MPVTPMGFLLYRGLPPLSGPLARRLGIALLAFILNLRNDDHRKRWSHHIGRGTELRTPASKSVFTAFCRLQGLAPTVNPYRS